MLSHCHTVAFSCQQHTFSINFIKIVTYLFGDIRQSGKLQKIVFIFMLIKLIHVGTVTVIIILIHIGTGLLDYKSRIEFQHQDSYSKNRMMLPIIGGSMKCS